MKHLKNRLLEAPQETSSQEEAVLKSDILKSTKVFDLSCRKLHTLPSDMITFCRQSSALVLNLHKNALTSLPQE